MQWLLIILVLPYIFLLLKIYKKLPAIIQYTCPTDYPGIFLSIVVACRNEEKNLPDFLNDIAKQNYPSELFELIIVDDNSTDRTIEIARAFYRPGNMVILKNNSTGKKSAIRTGVEAARSDLIITTDADCRMGDKWIRTIASFYELRKPGMIICPVQIDTQSGFFGKFQELEFLSLQGVTVGTASAGNATMCNGANLFFKKEIYHEHFHNLHDEIESGDDVFFLHSLKKEKKEEILWLESNDATVTSGSSRSVGSYLRQRARWISKGTVYNDRFTILLAIVTFIAILALLFTLIAGFFYPAYWPVFMAIILLKSIPDFLILSDRSSRYDRKKLMDWFIPVQAVYPFYVLSVAIYSLKKWRGWKDII